MTMAFLGALLHPSGRYSSFIIIHGSQNDIWAILSFPSWTPLFNLVMKPAIPAPSPTRSRADGLCPNPSVVCHCTQNRLLTLYHDLLGSPPRPCLSPWCRTIPQAPTFFASFCFWNSGSPSCLQASALLSTTVALFPALLGLPAPSYLSPKSHFKCLLFKSLLS